MWDDLGINILASVLFAVAGWIGHKTWEAHRRRYGQERVKLTYYRVLRFAVRGRGDPPYYSRSHHSEPINEAEGAQLVYDEVWCLNSSFSRLPEVQPPIRITSSGTVDALQVLPVVALDADNHPHTRDNPSQFTAAHPDPTLRLMAVGTLINGLQLPTQRWFGTTAQHDGQTLVIVADFSSLPFARRAIRDIHATVIRAKQTVPKESLVTAWYEERISEDIYIARLSDARRDDVIKVEFSIDEDRVPVLSG